MVTEKAIVVRDARKSFGADTQILAGLNMTVSKGSIYGLLGASGCGKTTLLSCVVGVRRLDSGSIWILGELSGSKGCAIAASRIGYMPQEISLASEFTGLEALYYFGRINGLTDEEIEERLHALAKLFELPLDNRYIKDMSGGQQRRVSFAAALLHKPELMILDEPTVGLDPELRNKIWQHLIKLTREEAVTIVITTHYIEEAKPADKIGLMRQGELLVELAPNAILERFQCDTLEEAFLTSCERQNYSKSHGFPSVSTIVDEEEEAPSTTEAEINVHTVERDHQPGRNFNGRKLRSSFRRRFRALMSKNMVQFVRDSGGMLIALILPILQVCCFHWSIGKDPHGISIAVVNDEMGNCNSLNMSGRVIYNQENDTCEFIDLSCRFLHDYGNSIATQVYYENFLDAKEAVTRSNVAGIIYFASNFSEAMRVRFENLLSASNGDIIASQIRISLDMGNRQIGLHLQQKLYDRFFEIQKAITQDCNITPKYAEMPIKFETPIYGSKNADYQSFVAPAFLPALIFTLANAVSSSLIITDRYAGVWDRSLVQGVKTFEILLSHLIFQTALVVFDVVLVTITTFAYFQLECRGSLLIVISLVFLTGMCGLCYGFLISVVCSTHTMANYLSVGTFYPMVLLGGVVWPYEAMPKFLQYISLAMPNTLTGTSIRNVLNKGYSIHEPSVYGSFILLMAWLIIIITFALMRLKAL